MELHSILNSVGTGIALLSILWIAAVKITRLEVKVETMWGFLMKRAIIEGIDRGLMTVNSPVRLEPHSSEMLIHLAEELREFKKKNSNLREADLALEIEKQFGDRLVHEVCIPNSISFGVCLLIATAVANNAHTLTEILDENHILKRKE